MFAERSTQANHSYAGESCRISFYHCIDEMLISGERLLDKFEMMHVLLYRWLQKQHQTD
jgi:hypothetical protein